MKKLIALSLVMSSVSLGGIYLVGHELLTIKKTIGEFSEYIKKISNPIGGDTFPVRFKRK